MILIASLCGLFFFAINKILLNVYYSLHHTGIPAAIAVLAVGTNIFLNWLLIDYWHAVGLALATTIAALLQTILLYVVLYYYFKLNLYLKNLTLFILRYAGQMGIIGAGFIGIYWIGSVLFDYFSSSFFLTSVGFWLWVGPLCALFMLTLYITRAWFGVRILFFEGE